MKKLTTALLTVLITFTITPLSHADDDVRQGVPTCRVTTNYDQCDLNRADD